jgi:hypothetical protein
MTRESSSPEHESHVKRGLAIALSAVLIGSMVAAGIGSVGAATAANSPEEAVFEVDSAETNAPITVNETFETTMVVTNTGNQTATKEVWFKLGSHHKDDTQVELAPGETKTVELSWKSTEYSDGTWELTATTPDDSVSRMVEIREPGSDGSTDSSDTDHSSHTDDTSNDGESSGTAEAADDAPAPDGPSMYTIEDSAPATVTVDGAAVPTLPEKGTLFDAMAARDDGERYDYTRTTAEVDGNDTAVVLIDVDGDDSPEMAFVDRDGDGTPDPTRKQFHALYPNVNWATWNSLVA